VSTTLPASPAVAIGVGFDTGRFGHHVTFLRADLEPACPAFDFPECRAGYDQVLKQLHTLQQHFGDVHLQIRVDVAGQYANNLEAFLWSLPFAKTISMGEPTRNQRYRQALFPKRKADPVESLCAARFALVEQPRSAFQSPAAVLHLREIVHSLDCQTRQCTRLTNQLHSLLARVFPELAMLVTDLQSQTLLRLLHKYPTPQLLARARQRSLTAIPYLTEERAIQLQAAANATVASFTGVTAAALVQCLAKQLQHSLTTEAELKEFMTDAYARLPETNHIETIPGIGVATAAVLTAKIVTIERFATDSKLVNYFGVFPEEYQSGLAKNGKSKPGRRRRMSHKGYNLARKYLWNAAKSAIRHNPAVRPLYARLRSRGTRGDVALGHCMNKLLRLVFAIWKSGQPFDPAHYPWEDTKQQPAGHKQDVSPDRKVVTASTATVPPQEQPHKPGPSQTPPGPGRSAVESIDYAALSSQVSMEQALGQLGWIQHLKGSGAQRRGPCPIHGSPADQHRPFSVNLPKGIFQCFHPPCAAKGNVLDLWAAVQDLPLNQAVQHLTETFHIELQPASGTVRRNP
jgi:transposase